LLRRDGERPDEQAVNKAVVGIDSKDVDPVRDNLTDIAVEEF